MPLFEQILARYEGAGNARGAAIVIGLIGNTYKRLGNLEKAEELLLRALSEKRALGDRLEEGRTLSNLGLLYWDKADYRAAIDNLNQSLSIALSVNDRELEGAALNNLGLVYDEQGDYQRSTEHFTRAVALHRSTGFARGESDALGNLGGVQLSLGRYHDALEQYRRALVLSEQNKSNVQQSQDLTNIGVAQLGLGEVDQAVASFDRAVTLASAGGLAKEEADARKGRASALRAKARLDEALAEYQLVMTVYERAGLKRELVSVLLDSARLLASVGDIREAVRQGERAHALAESIGYALGLKRARLALGDFDWQRGQYVEARRRFTDVLDRARSDKDQATAAAALVSLAQTALELRDPATAERHGLDGLTLARDSGAKVTEAAALYALGEADRRRGQSAPATARYRDAAVIAAAIGDADLQWRIAFAEGRVREAERDLDGAVDRFLEATRVIEQVRNRLAGQRYRAGYLGDKHEVYAALVRVLLARGRTADAFAYAERLRALSYFELIQSGPVRVADGTQRQTEAELAGRIRRIQEALQGERDRAAAARRAEAVAAYSGELDAAERAYGTLLDELRRTNPEQAAVRTLETPPVASLQAALPAGTALIEYVVADEELAVFVVTRTGVRARLIPIARADLQSRVELLRDLLAREGTDRWRKPAAGLYEVLVTPLRSTGWLDGIRELVVVPHGVLHYVPFAALVGPGPSPRFLVEDFGVAIAPAATALVARRAPGTPRGSLLAAAPARARLRFAADEARSIAATAGGGDLVLLGAAATEQAFKHQARHFRLLHLATHGFFNRTNPLLSGVELEGDTENDGRLQVFEILGLELNASLVTLSACDTALGSGLSSDLPAGEEFVGLTRAFLTAGSRAVLATLWEINDRATPALMTEFYRLTADRSFAQALAAAQRAAIARGGRESHPYYWAPFVLVGAN